MTLHDLIQAAIHNQVFSGVMGGSLVMSVLYAVRGGRADQELHVKELDHQDARTLCERFLGANGATEALLKQLTFPVAPAEIQKVLLASRSLN